MSELTREAEDYLARLDRALWPLSPSQRQAVMLEIRCHLEERFERGSLHLMSSLEHMGPPEEIARAFVEAAGRKWHTRPANDDQLPAVIRQTTLPIVYKPRRAPLPIREMIDKFRRTYQASRNGIWSIFAVLIACLTATNFLVGIDKLSAGADGMPMWFVISARLTVTILAMVAAYRALLTQDDLIWNWTSASARFAAATIGMLGLTTVIFLGVQSVIASISPFAVGSAPSVAINAMTVLGIVTASAITYLRIQPWVVSQAIDDDRVTLAISLQGTSDKMRHLVTGWMVFVGPLILIHAVISMAMSAMPYQAFIENGLAICMLDALVSALILMAVTILNSIAFRWTVNEPIPDASPFSTITPTNEEVARMREILKAHIEQRRMAKFVRTHWTS